MDSNMDNAFFMNMVMVLSDSMFVVNLFFLTPNMNNCNGKFHSVYANARGINNII